MSYRNRTDRIENLTDDLVWDDHACIITQAAFDRLPNYTRSQPTGPRPGFVYRKNLHWTGPPDNWFVYVCTLDPEDPEYVLHNGRQALLVPS